MRNVIKQANEGKKNIANRYDLSLGEVEQLCDMFKGNAEIADLYDVIGNAFYMGYNVGCKHPSEN